jgi:hypothetical protein
MAAVLRTVLGGVRIDRHAADGIDDTLSGIIAMVMF